MIDNKSGFIHFYRSFAAMIDFFSKQQSKGNALTVLSELRPMTYQIIAFQIGLRRYRTDRCNAITFLQLTSHKATSKTAPDPHRKRIDLFCKAQH